MDLSELLTFTSLSPGDVDRARQLAEFEALRDDFGVQRGHMTDSIEAVEEEKVEEEDEEAVNLAAVVALRDAGAHFVTTFGATPDIALWLNTIATRERPAGTSSSMPETDSAPPTDTPVAVESAADITTTSLDEREPDERQPANASSANPAPSGETS